MSWWIGCGVLLLTVGFAKLSTVILNRMLALPQPKWTMGGTELVQISLIPIYFGLLADHLIRRFDGRIENLITPLVLALVSVGIFGLILLIRATIRYQSYRPPQCQISSESRTIDFRKSDGQGSWQELFVGIRPMRRVALLPRNEQFTIEVNIKTFLLPHFPQEWDGLSIVHLTDTHFRGAVSRKYFEAVCDQAIDLKPDLFVFTGDLLDDPALLYWVSETFGRLKARLGQYFILGNHDWYFDTAAIRQEFQRHGWIDLASRSIALDQSHPGPGIILSGDETPWMGCHPVLPPESKSGFQILLSHSPDNITWARDHNIDLMLSGHTHGGQICLPILGPIYSPSRFGCRFASGVFWLDPTLLYVSRGISGREPVRYGCVPELTKIAIKSSR